MWSVSAMMLDNLPVSGRPTNLENSRARAYCACSKCGLCCLDFFFSSIIPLLFLWDTISAGCAVWIFFSHLSFLTCFSGILKYCLKAKVPDL